MVDGDDCFLCDKVSGKKISSFRKEAGLLVFDDSTAMCLSSMRQGVVAEDRVLLSYLRIGHPPFELLKLVIPPCLEE